MHILFADDVQDMRELYQLAFGRLGHTMHLCSDGGEAVQAAKQFDFDAIILDMAMPEINGWEALKRIRQLWRNEHVPIILLSGYSMPDIEEFAQKAGADCLVLKPVLPAELIRIIENLIAAKKQKN